MKIITIFVLCLLVACSAENLSEQEIAQFSGNWSGSGRFYNVEFNKEYGRLDFKLQIKPDGSITGTVGDAKVTNWIFVKNKGRIDLLTTLEGKIDSTKAVDKDQLAFLFVEILDDKIIGDFHLKNNTAFDFSMRPGEFTLNKSPE